MAATVVLVVEDDSAVQGMLRGVFQAAGFSVQLVDTGAEALRILEAQPPDAVTVDLGLPDGRSQDLLGWLRQHSIPWLVISALDARDAAKQYGPFDGRFIAKPFDPWDMVDRLEGLLAPQR